MRSRAAVAFVCALVVLVSMLGLSAAQAQDLTTARQKAEAAAARVLDAQKKADAAGAAFFAAESTLDQLQVEIDQRQHDLGQAQQAADTLRDQAREFVIDEYTSSSDLAALLNMSDLNKAVVQQSLSGVVSNHNSNVLEQYRQAMSDLQTQTTALNARKADQSKQVDALAKLRDAQQSTVRALQTESANLNAQLAQLEEQDRQRIAAELKAKQDAQRKAQEEAAARAAAAAAAATTTTRRTTSSPTPTVSTGTKPGSSRVVSLAACPVSGASFTDTYGQPRSGGRPHLGVDMLTVIGTPIKAPVSGTVRFSGDANGGNTFILNGNDGNFYYGAHLSRYGQGGTVSAGTVVGYVGQTGDATAPHLHLEIHIGGYGNPINPYPSVAAVC